MPRGPETLWRALVFGTALVGASNVVAALFVPVGGCGTVVSLITEMWAWGLVSALASPAFADGHPGTVLLLAIAISLVIYAVPQVALAASAHRFGQRAAVVAILTWSLFYASLLLWLGQAPDCP